MPPATAALHDAWAGAALPVAAVLLLAFAARAGTGVGHERVRREKGTVFLGERVMQRGYAWIEAGARRCPLGADAISWISVALGLVSGACLALGWPGWSAWALALSGVCDGLDGAVARRLGTAGPGGAVLDSALDRYVEFFVLAGALVWFRGCWPAQLMVAAALLGSFMVTYSTAKAEALRVVPPRGWMKRAERVVWLLAGFSLGGASALAGAEPAWLAGGAIGVIAVFANLSAVVRLAALRRAAGG